MPDTAAELPEVPELEQTAAWRLRLVDANPADTVSAAAAVLLEQLAADLRHQPYEPLRAELRSICNWLVESDAISDFAECAMAYRAGIGVSAHPQDGAAYLAALLAIARDHIG